MQQHPSESCLSMCPGLCSAQTRVAMLPEQPCSAPAPGGTGARQGDGVESLLSPSAVHRKDKSLSYELASGELEG